MGKQKKKRNGSLIELICEWAACTDQQHLDSESFADHLNGHIEQIIAGHDENEESKFYCGWFGCGEKSFDSTDELIVHVSYHGFHTKLMSFGTVVMKAISEDLGKEVTCNIDGSTRTVLPDLPNMFVCVWKDCPETFYRAEDFYKHVEKHPFESTDQSSTPNDDDDQRSNEGLTPDDRALIPFGHLNDLEPSSFPSCFSPINSEGEGPSFFIKDPVRCYWSDCNFISDSNSHIAQHLRSHTQEKIIACPICGGMFSNKGKFRDHILRQLEDYEDALNDQAITLKINDQEFRVTITPSSIESPTSSGIVYRCDQCDKSFHSSSLLREHNRRHFHSQQCDLCGRTMESPSALKHHMTYRHSEDRPFACQFCTIRCKTRSDLRRHLETHSKSNPFKCSLCKFECRCCHTLTKHIKKYHQSSSIVNEYLCHECGKKFTRGNNLSRHLSSIHGYTLQPGQSRFTYIRDSDGIYILDQSST